MEHNQSVIKTRFIIDRNLGFENIDYIILKNVVHARVFFKTETKVVHKNISQGWEKGRKFIVIQTKKNYKTFFLKILKKLPYETFDDL